MLSKSFSRKVWSLPALGPLCGHTSCISVLGRRRCAPEVYLEVKRNDLRSRCARKPAAGLWVRQPRRLEELNKSNKQFCKLFLCGCMASLGDREAQKKTNVAKCRNCCSALKFYIHWIRSQSECVRRHPGTLSSSMISMDASPEWMRIFAARSARSALSERLLFPPLKFAAVVYPDAIFKLFTSFAANK